MTRILSLFLAFTMLVGSVGVTVNRHFCMGELKSLTLFGEPAVCAMHAPATKPPCPLHGNGQQRTEKMKGCCDDEAQFLSWDDDRQVYDQSTLPALPSVDLPQPASFFPEYVLHPRTAALALFRNYRPPPLVFDVPSRWQVFRL